MQEDGVIPADPDLTPFADFREGLKRIFRQQLLANIDEPFLGITLTLPALGPTLIQIDIVENTAAVVLIAQESIEPQPHRLLATAILLSGFDQADDAALEAAKQAPGFLDNPFYPPETYDSAREAAKPLMVNCLISQEAFMNPHVRLICETLADAFFDMFGQTQDEDEEDGSDEGDESDESAA
jgi:hypothetical protein